MGENSIEEKITAASMDPTTLTMAPKWLASSTRTTTNKNGAASFQFVLEKTSAKTIAHNALTAIPTLDCNVYRSLVFMCFHVPKSLIKAYRVPAVLPTAVAFQRNKDRMNRKLVVANSRAALAFV